MGALLSLLAGWRGYAAVAAACLALGISGTYKVMHTNNLADQAVAAKKTVQVIERQGKITFDVEMNFEKVRIAQDENTRKRQEEVPIHVTPQIDNSYPVPCGFVRVFNAATHGPIPDPAGCPDDAASDVALSAVGEVETENAGKYDQISAQLIALQEWVRQQQQVK